MADPTRRERLLTFLLLPVIVVAVLVLAGVMFRSSFQLEKLGEQSVGGTTLLLANEKADRLDKNIIEQDNAVRAGVDVTERALFGSGSWSAKEGRILAEAVGAARLAEEAGEAGKASALPPLNPDRHART